MMDVDGRPFGVPLQLGAEVRWKISIFVADFEIWKYSTVVSIRTGCSTPNIHLSDLISFFIFTFSHTGQKFGLII